MSEVDQRLQRLKDAILEGKPEEAKQNAYGALAQGRTANEVLDALVDAVNIIVDLHEVGEYDHSRVMAAENAVGSCLEAVEDQLAKSEGRFNVKATSGPVGLKAGHLLSLAISASLRAIGFRCTPLSKTQTALELLRNSEELGAELVIPLLSGEGGGEEQLQSFMEALERGGFKMKFEVIPIVPGLAENYQGSLNVARNSGEAISIATEWALKRQNRK